jgi:hypothetical protein
VIFFINKVYFASYCLHNLYLKESSHPICCLANILTATGGAVRLIKVVIDILMRGAACFGENN